MGFKVTLLHFPEASKSEALAVTGSTGSGEPGEYCEGPLSGAEMAGGGYLIWQNWVGGEWDEADFKEFSKAHPLIVQELSETVMYSACTSLRGGEVEWAIVHDSQQAIDHLETRGAVPPALATRVEALRAEASEKQSADDEVDWYFEIPVEVFKGFSGMRHDEENQLAFEALEGPEKVKKPFWKFWN